MSHLTRPTQRPVRDVQMFDDVCMLKRVKRHWYIWYFIENDPQHLGPFFLALNMDPKR